MNYKKKETDFLTSNLIKELLSQVDVAYGHKKTLVQKLFARKRLKTQFKSLVKGFAKKVLEQNSYTITHNNSKSQ